MMKRLERALLTAMWSASTTEAMALEANLPTRRQPDANPGRAAESGSNRAGEVTGSVTGCEHECPPHEHESKDLQIPREPSPTPQSDAYELSPGKALREQAAAYERYKNLTEFEKERLDNIELVERFDPGYSDRVSAQYAAERERNMDYRPANREDGTEEKDQGHRIHRKGDKEPIVPV